MSVGWSKSRRCKRKERVDRNEMVLRGLEEQRLKALKEEDGKVLKENKKHKEIAGYVFDEEKKCYFPRSVLREEMKVFVLKLE